MKFEKLVSRLAGIGLPALVLIVANATTGLAGGAAVVTALAFLGGPLGIMGGIGVLLLLSQITQALAEYGLERLLHAVIDGLRANGLKREEALNSINRYPIPETLKATLRPYLAKL